MSCGTAIIQRKQGYRVKSLLGCFSFPVWDCVAGRSAVFPPQRSRAHYRTQGYRLRVLYEGVSHHSYRQVAQSFNRQVWQDPAIGISYRSLQYEASSEASAFESELQRCTSEVLSTHRFDLEGHCPLEQFDWVESPMNPSFEAKLATHFTQMCQDAPEKIRPKLQLKAAQYEQVAQSVYIGIDDVCNKEQKSQRPPKAAVSPPEQQEDPLLATESSGPGSNRGRDNGKKKYKKRKFLFHTVAHIITHVGTYCLTSAKMGQLWPHLMALLLHNDLLEKQWILLVDGQITLQDSLKRRLAWRPFKSILDWYHLRKKIHAQLFKSVHKNEQRDQLFWKLEQALWYGLVAYAQQIIEQIETDIIKNQEELTKLSGYLERNKDLIPNFELRSRLGLINSSNRVEKENDFLVSKRQKKNGMSWTRKGSDALATLMTIQRNNELEKWIAQNEITFKIAA